MEKKQNIQNRIEEIYNGNKKIPFMQSKDILLLGYTYGLDDSNKNIIDSISKTVTDNISKKDNKTNISKEKQGFTGTTKELITHANENILKEKIEIVKKEYEQQLKTIKKEHEKYLNLEILNTQVTLTGKILNYINIHHDVIEMYDYIKNLNKEFQDKYFIAKTNYGEYKIR